MLGEGCTAQILANANKRKSLLLNAFCFLGPFSNFFPVPELAGFQDNYRLWEILKSPVPGVDDRRVGSAESLGNLVRSDDVLWVHEAWHQENRTARLWIHHRRP